MNIHDAIRSVIDGIPSNHIFDSHFVINKLIKEHSDAYLNFASSVSASSRKTATVHGLMAQEITRFVDLGLVTKLDALSWSETIHRTDNECAAWMKR